MDVSIVIPTKNAGPLFEKVLDAVFHQKTEYEYEVICVDSGSKDGTLDLIRKYPCRLFQIPPSEFGHGKTRNYGASKGTGTYIVFITQDALPATDTWLQNFIDAMRMDPEIVGGFGIHYPYPDCNLLDKRDLDGHFKGFGETNTIFHLDDPERYEREEGYRHYLAFFSDNNSCIRRDVFEKYPYDDVNFAEDQIWARKMIELGFKKVYCPYAPVYHSHNFKLSTYFKRYYDEQKGLYEVHQYMIAQKWTQLPGMLYRQVRGDCVYIKHQPISKKEKIHWAFYSLFRNCGRFFGGYLGGKYHLYSPGKQAFLDRHISQQYDQRHA
ncbi:MAG: glycosyltransferase family A protein [Fusicatenibacter sp.]|nr:glycosyltransferase family A protein [Lachnospiraceae bacterium]MDY2939129.1 glycosyltransferase family A protein [Fusicatenibacter sp.]